MSCRRREHMLQSPAEKKPLALSERAEDRLLQREGTHLQNLLAFKYCLHRVSWWVVGRSCQHKKFYKMADKGHLRRKEYSSEVLEQHVKPTRSAWGKYEHLTLQGDKTTQTVCKVTCEKCNARFIRVNDDGGNTVHFTIQMALRAQQRVIYCRHGFVSVFQGRYSHVSIAFKSKKIMHTKSMEQQQKYMHFKR